MTSIIDHPEGWTGTEVLVKQVQITLTPVSVTLLSLQFLRILGTRAFQGCNQNASDFFNVPRTNQ